MQNKNTCSIWGVGNSSTTTSDFSLLLILGYAIYMYLSFSFSDQKSQTLRSIQRRYIALWGDVGRMTVA